MTTQKDAEDQVKEGEQSTPEKSPTVERKDQAEHQDKAKETKAIRQKLKSEGVILTDGTKFFGAMNIEGAESKQTKPKKAEPVDLTKEAIDKKVDVVRSALKSGVFTGDGSTVINTLATLSETDRKAVIEAYDQKFGKGQAGTFMKEVNASLSKADAVSVGSIVDRTSGETNHAGNVQLALTLAKSDSVKGNELLAKTLMSLTSEQIDELKKNYQEKFGTSLTDAIKKDTNVSAATKEALGILETGADKRTSDDLVKLAKIAAANGDQKLFAEALSGDLEAAKQARTTLQNDKTFVIPKKWDQQVTKDIMQEGHPALATIVQADVGLGILSANKTDISLAVQHSSPEEKQQYIEGKKLALEQRGKADTSNLTPEQQKALEFYTKLNSQLKRAGDASEVTAWEDQLLNGKKTIVSTMVEAQDDHWLSAKTHTTQKLLSAAENLTKEDWQFLNRHKDANDPYWNQVRDSLKTYATPAEQERVLSLLQQKANAESFEQSKTTRRSLDDAIADNTRKGRSGTTLESGGDTNFANAVASMSPADAKQYNSDAAYKARVDNFVKQNLTGTEQAYATALLKQVEASGAPPVVTPELRILQDKINKVPQELALRNIQEALKDDGLRKKVEANFAAKPADQSTDPVDKEVRKIISQQVQGAFGADLYTPDGSVQQDGTRQALDSLLKTGKLPISLQLEQGLPITKETLTDIAKAAPEVQQKALKFLQSNKAQLEVAQNVIKQEGKVDLADEVRAFALGNKIDPKELKEQLKSANIGELRNEYARKYNRDLDSDLLTKFDKPADQAEVKRTLQQSTDAGQALFDSVARADESGFVNDGTRLTMNRASEEFFARVQEANVNKTELSKEDIQKLSEYSEETARQYEESKKALAAAVADGALTVGSLAAVPLTGGVSLVGLSLAAGIGGAAKVGIHAAIEGGSYTSTDAAKHALSGGVQQASNFVGGQYAAKLFGVGEKIAARTADDVVKISQKVAGTEAALIDPAKQPQLQSAIRNMIQDKLGTGGSTLDQKAIHELAEKFSLSPGNTQNVAALESVIQNSLKQEVGSAGMQAAESAGLQAIGFGAGGAIGETGNWDPNKSASENLTNVLEGGVIAAGIGLGGSVVGSGIQRLRGEGKAAAAAAGDVRTADDAARLRSDSPQPQVQERGDTPVVERTSSTEARVASTAQPAETAVEETQKLTATGLPLKEQTEGKLGQTIYRRQDGNLEAVHRQSSQADLGGVDSMSFTHGADGQLTSARIGRDVYQKIPGQDNKWKLTSGDARATSEWEGTITADNVTGEVMVRDAKGSKTFHPNGDLTVESARGSKVRLTGSSEPVSWQSEAGLDVEFGKKTVEGGRVVTEVKFPSGEVWTGVDTDVPASLSQKWRVTSPSNPEGTEIIGSVQVWNQNNDLIVRQGTRADRFSLDGSSRNYALDRTEVAHDASGRVSESVTPDGKKTRFTYAEGAIEPSTVDSEKFGTLTRKENGKYELKAKNGQTYDDVEVQTVHADGSIAMKYDDTVVVWRANGDEIANADVAGKRAAAEARLKEKDGEGVRDKDTPDDGKIRERDATTSPVRDKDAEGASVKSKDELIKEKGYPVNEKGQLLDSKGNVFEEIWPTLNPKHLETVRDQVKSELAQVKASDGGSVLQKLENAGLSENDMRRVLDSLGETREHYALSFASDLDQQVNWIHTMGEFGRVIDVAKAQGNSPEQIADKLLASMFSDSVKNKSNFMTHHLDGERAAMHVLGGKLDGEFTQERLDNITRMIRAHQIAPPKFMDFIYSSAIKGSIKAEGREMTEAEVTALASLSKKMQNPLTSPLVDAPGGGKMLDLNDDERALLRRTGNDKWFVDRDGFIDADGIDNYATAGGLSKIIQIRGPETAPFFKDGNFRYENPDRKSGQFVSSSQESWRDSYRDFVTVASPEGLKLAKESLAQAEEAAVKAQGRVDDWLRQRLSIPPGQDLPTIPGWTGKPKLDAAGKPVIDAETGLTVMIPDNLKYPDPPAEWWALNAKPKRTAEEDAIYNDPAKRYKGLNEQEIEQFKLAKEIRDRYAAELRKEQRVAGDAAPDYKPTPVVTGAR